MVTASDAVFDTVELLENILLHLPLEDLLFAQKVCKMWKAAMKDSIIIQRVLFLKPISDMRICATEVPNPESSFKGVYTVWMVEDRNNLKLADRPYVNPFLTKYVNYLHDRAFFKHTFISPSDPSKPRARVSPQKLAEHLKGSTLDKMLILQPPASQMHIMCWEEERNVSKDMEFHEVEAADVNGVCVPDFRLACVKHWAYCPNCPYHELSDADEGWRWLGHGLIELPYGPWSYIGHEIYKELKQRSQTTSV